MIEIVGDQVFAHCDMCGKPLTIGNDNGMFCEDMCGNEESIQANIQINSILDTVNSLLEKGL